MRLKLTTKFSIVTSSVLLITMVLFAFLNIRTLKTAFLEEALGDLEHLSETIIRTTHYQMLEDDRQRVYQMMEEVGEQKGIERIRLLDKEGIIRFSTEKSEIGQYIHVDEEGCNGCHSGEKPLVNVPSSMRSRIFHNERGVNVLGLTKEIRNQRSCTSAQCHFHSQEAATLGILDVHISLAGMNDTVNSYRNEILVFTFALLFVLSLCLAFLTRRFVNVPVLRLVEHTRKLAGGEWESRIRYSPGDELGDLADSFNDMTQKLKSAHDQLENWGKKSQESLGRVTRALEARSRCNRTIITAADEPELMNGICRIIVEVGGYRLAWVGVAQQKGEKKVQPAAWCCREIELPTAQIAWMGEGATGQAIRTGETTVSKPLPSCPADLPMRSNDPLPGDASSISLPLFYSGRTFGALTIMADEPDAFDTEEVNLLEKLADDLSYGIAMLRVKAEQKNVEKERRLLAAVIDQTSEGVLTFDSNGTVQYVNPAFERICEYPREEIIGRKINAFGNGGRNEGLVRTISEALAAGEGRTDHFNARKRDGTPYEINVKVFPIWDGAGTIISYAVEVQDVTHEVQLEGQLRLAQKMEAIGTLAGGIAHDFNNVLAAIISNAEMALDDIPTDSTLRDHLEIVLRAGRRGKNLTRQILALSRRGDQERKSVQIDRIVKECLALLRASLPVTIEIRQDIVPGLGQVLADPTQIHQVIMNLCTNAAHAMEDKGGVLEVRLAEMEMDAAGAAGHPDLHPGQYLRLTVTDTGHGMEASVMERIFDPFFTTKDQGKGTGLGLSVVHGIVRSHGGAITVSSKPGRGTTFDVFLPRIQCLEVGMEPETTEPFVEGRGRILFLDDEEDLVFAGRKMLERLGYEVLGLTDARQALETFRCHPERFDLVITDLTMPHMTGLELAGEILRLRPEMPIILCTGFGSASGGSVTPKDARAAGIRELVMKPCDRTEMVAIIRRVLEESRQTGT